MLSAAEIEQLPDEVKSHITGLADIDRNYEARISQAGTGNRRPPGTAQAGPVPEVRPKQRIS
jgi:hypothetical protein